MTFGLQFESKEISLFTEYIVVSVILSHTCSKSYPSIISLKLFVAAPLISKSELSVLVP